MGAPGGSVPCGRRSSSHCAHAASWRRTPSDTVMPASESDRAASLFSAPRPTSGALGADPGGRPSPCVHIISAPKLLTRLTVWRRSGSDLVGGDAWTPRPALPGLLQLLGASPHFLPLTRFPGSPPAARGPRSGLWETPPGPELACTRLLTESLWAFSVSGKRAGWRGEGGVGALAAWIQVAPPGAWSVSVSLSLF